MYIAVVVHEARQRPRRMRYDLSCGENEEAILGDGRVERRALRLPIGQELVECPRVDDGAGEYVRADLRALLEDADGDFVARLRRELLQTDRRREAGGAAADDHDVVFHGFAWHGGILLALNLGRACRIV